jgi:hypothetical protein
VAQKDLLRAIGETPEGELQFVRHGPATRSCKRHALTGHANAVAGFRRMATCGQLRRCGS